MSTLSAEQLERIARNKALALSKKRKALLDENDKSLNVLPPKYQAIVSNSCQNITYATDNRSLPAPASSIEASCRLISQDEFTVHMPFHAASIEIMKSINGRRYDPAMKSWVFPLSSYETVIDRLRSLVTIKGLPSVILSSVRKRVVDPNQVDISKIDKALLDTILPFQEEGIRFGITQKGRCIIADDMGLGKTIQALGIAHYYKENWPLIIVCPSSVKYSWEAAVQAHLPSVNPFYVNVLSSYKDLIDEAKIVICSYGLLQTCMNELYRKRFGVIILDESHSLKSLKAARTKAALRIAGICKNVILLSGTPALSRPIELYSQIIAIHPKGFPSICDFGLRYCNGQKKNFGWDFRGSSNMEELGVFLRTMMIRRVKSDVMGQLPSKIRKVIYLNVDMAKVVAKKVEASAKEFELQKGAEKKSALFHYYATTGEAKAKAVSNYLAEKLEGDCKIIIFAHHAVMLNALCETLGKKSVGYIKIDGCTGSSQRKLYCDEFQNNDGCRVAVLSLKAANAGITLTAAQLVIFAELYWNPGELIQAEDRAHRIGQQECVIVEYLIAKKTVDEFLWKLVQSKLNTLASVGLNPANVDDVCKKSTQENNLLNYLRNTSEEETFNSDEFNKHLFSEIQDDDDDIFKCIDLDGT